MGSGKLTEADSVLECVEERRRFGKNEFDSGLRRLCLGFMEVELEVVSVSDTVWQTN